jgi:ferrochelatase
VTIGVVLMTYGAPRTRADVPGYLAKVRGGKKPDDALVAEMTRRYERIGWSPLVERTVAQAKALERELGRGWRVTAGMRYSAPSIADAVEELVWTGAKEIVGIVMSPQWSPLLMGGYERALREAAERFAPRVPVVVAREWHREPLFIDAITERIGEALADIADRDRVPLMLTAHSLPKRVFDAEPGYVAQMKETAELIAAAAGLARGRWRWAYQSAGHTTEEWLRPDLKDLFPALAEQGHRDVLVVPIQFLADHLEVLYDLDVAAAAEATATGLRYHRIVMPNTHPTFIATLAVIARRSAMHAAHGGNAAVPLAEDTLARGGGYPS